MRTDALVTDLAGVTVSNDLLRLKLAEALAASTARLTPRDIRVPAIPGKALAVIGVRRSGKTSFMAQPT